MTHALSLYDIETELIALSTMLESADDEQQAAIQQQVTQYLAAATEKRDRMAQYLRHLEHAEQLHRDEEARLAERRRRIVAHRERLEQYVIRAMEDTHTTRLDGKTNALCVRNKPPHVEITDAAALPGKHIHVSLTVDGDAVERIQEVAGDRVIAVEIRPVKANIAAALKAGDDVPGAALVLGGKRLEIR